ncbi:MAG TPA: hypothetical protein VHE12_08210 [bacterium]|nr:hypothetical protein [bacterium]
MRKTFLCLSALFITARVLALDLSWDNRFFFYGDNSEFFEPYRTGETLLGQQGNSYFEAALGPRTFLQFGVFGDFRSTSTQDPAVDVKPLLSFQYREGGSRFVMGTLVADDRHGFLEPLEVTTLEITRPVEYGFQWIENDPGFQCDLFLDWHQLNVGLQPEEFDYGGVLRKPLDDDLELEGQFHGFHMGGQLSYTIVFNNWVPALGFRWKVPGLLGMTRFSAFGVGAGHLEGGATGSTQWGGGGYLKTEVHPDDLLDLFGIGWVGRDFYSQEGDANYASYSTPDSASLDQLHGFVKSERTYFELGALRDFPMDGGAVFRAEFRVHFMDDTSAYSYKLSVRAPLDIDLGNLKSGSAPAEDR